MADSLQDIIDLNEAQPYADFEKDLLRYIPQLRDFLIKNKDLPRNQYSEGFGEVNKSNPSMWTKRSIRVSNSDGSVRPFTYGFAQFCLQVARNMSPYQTGNLRDNIDVQWSASYIRILFNAKGTATYTMYLDNGYPNAKWMGFIQNIRTTIVMLCSWYQSKDEEDEKKLEQAMRSLARGGQFMRKISDLTGDKSRASVVKFRRATITGWDRERLEKGRKTITPQERSMLGARTNIRKEGSKQKQMISRTNEKVAIKGVKIRYDKQIRERSNSKTRGG